MKAHWLPVEEQLVAKLFVDAVTTLPDSSIPRCSGAHVWSSSAEGGQQEWGAGKKLERADT